ncbi:MAG: metallophosphoesterase family protein [Kiritimatiellia bacterium]
MRYAILSDVHANETALRAVLVDAADARAEKIVCLGDVLGYGPEPVQALELLYRKAHVCLAGNHDDAASGRYPLEDFTDFAAAAVERHRAALSPTALDWLGHLPHVCEFPGFEGRSRGAFACAHGDFAAPERFDYVLEPRDAMASWRARTEQLLFVGHTHKPGIFVLGPSGEPHALEPCDFVLEEGKRYLVNVGSVGYPRSGACRSFYCIYDDQSCTVFFRSLPFDLEGYRAKMNGQGLDESPWIRARAEERAQTEVRGAERFGKPRGENKKKARGAPKAVARGAAAPVVVVGERRNFGPALVVGALIVALAGVWCTVKLVRTVSPRADVAGVRIETVEEEAAPVASDAAPTELGPVVVRRRCTIPLGGRRLRFAVKLKRGGAPVWVHVRFENGNGEPAGDGLWCQNVRLSKRSPKAGLVAPEGATAAFLEVVKAHADDACEVVEAVLEPAKENAR